MHTGEPLFGGADQADQMCRIGTSASQPYSPSVFISTRLPHLSTSRSVCLLSLPLYLFLLCVALMGNGIKSLSCPSLSLTLSPSHSLTLCPSLSLSVHLSHCLYLSLWHSVDVLGMPPAALLESCQAKTRGQVPYSDTLCGTLVCTLRCTHRSCPPHSTVRFKRILISSCPYPSLFPSLHLLYYRILYTCYRLLFISSHLISITIFPSLVTHLISLSPYCCVAIVLWAHWSGLSGRSIRWLWLEEYCRYVHTNLFTIA